MCDPVSIAGLALSAASTYMGYQDQKAQADYQNKLAISQAKNANQATINSYTQSSLQDIQQENASAQEAQAQVEAARRNMATARVSAGEAGVAGLSVDALMRDIQGQGLSNIDVVNQNLSMSQQQTGMERRGIYAHGKSLTNDAASRMTARPSALGAALQIGGSAIGSYNDYQSRQPPKSSKRPTAQQLSGPF